MAVIGKIRSWGPILVCLIGFALLAFIASDLQQALEGVSRNKSLQLGEVLGKTVDIQDFNKLVEEYEEVYKMQGRANLNEDQMNQLRDQVWNTYITAKVIENEAKKIGLAVTDDEMKEVLKQGTNPMLLSTPFVNEQTQRFDVNALQKFFAEYEKSKNNPAYVEQFGTVYKYWTFIEKTLRQSILAQKYQTLLGACILSNPVEAEAYVKEDCVESDVNLAAFLYTDVKDSINVTDQELKAKYESIKQLFTNLEETRDAKYITVKISASSADREKIMEEMNGFKSALATTDPNEVIRHSASLISFLNLPVKKNAFPYDIQQHLDSVAVGGVSDVFETRSDNTFNVIKLVSKTTAPDSVKYRTIFASRATQQESKVLADSIATALRSGADFEALAKKYGQTGEERWLSTDNYQRMQTISLSDRKFIPALYEGATGEYQCLELEGNCAVVQVMEKRAMVDKYVVAVVKKTIDYSSDTRNQAYNKLSAFMSANQTLESVSKNAMKEGYNLLDAKDVVASGHTFAGIHSTNEVLRWLFGAKEGEVSELFDCGNSGDQLLYVLLEKVNKKGYYGLDNQSVKEYVEAEVQKDKKAELLYAKAKDMKSVEEAVKAGAKNDTISQITFTSPVAVKSGSEPGLAGAVAATAQGQFCKAPVKGEKAVFVFSVTKQEEVKDKKKDLKEAEQITRNRALQNTSAYMRELYTNAKVIDRRYMFF